MAKAAPKSKRTKEQTHYKSLFRGLAIYKQSNSQFWYARMWDTNGQRRVNKSAGEFARPDAEEVVRELYKNLQLRVPPVKDKKNQFKRFTERLDRNQDRVAGLERRSRYS